MPLRRQVDPEENDAFLHKALLKDSDRPNAHNTQKFREDFNAETLPLPKFHLHQQGMSNRMAYDLVKQHLDLDGKTALNLASFVHTGIDPEGLKLCEENITKNLADSDEYPALVDIMGRCVSILGNLWNTELGEEAVGTATTGSSEAAMMGGLAMKRRWEAQRKAKGLSTDKPNIIMGANAQVCLEKFARYFDVEMRLLPIKQEAHFSFSMDDLRKNVDENTIGVFAILGSTLTGHYQNVAEIAEILDEVERETGNDVSLHVDGASGAFVAPFCSPELRWDFRIPRVRSINASGHKYGLAPAGCGWILWRDQKYLPENLLFTLNYLGGSEITYNLNFSRPGHPIIHQYYTMVRNGFDGFFQTHSVSLEMARFLSFYLETTGYFDVLSDIHRPRGQFFSKSGHKSYKTNDLSELKDKPLTFFNGGLPVVSFTFTEEFKKKFPFIPQEAVSSMLRDKGYIIPNYSLPPSHENIEVLRIVINDNMSVDLLDMVMQDITRVTNKLISIGEKVQGADPEAIRATLSIVSAADHAEGQHESKWKDAIAKQATSAYSRC